MDEKLIEELYNGIRLAPDIRSVLLYALLIVPVENLAAKIILKALVVARLQQLEMPEAELSRLRAALAMETAEKK
jgi:hypothetical protein